MDLGIRTHGSAKRRSINSKWLRIPRRIRTPATPSLARQQVPRLFPIVLSFLQRCPSLDLGRWQIIENEGNLHDRIYQPRNCIGTLVILRDFVD